MKPCVHQFHPTFVPKDAISNQMKWIQSSLQEINLRGEIFFKGTSFANIKSHDWLLIHHSFGYSDLQKVFALKCNKALIYHNITPSQFLRHDPTLSHLSALGRAQLGPLKENTGIAFADSIYNASELEEVGFQNIETLPLLDLSEWKTETPSSKPQERYRLLFVGRLAPHKNQHLLIETLFILSKLMDCELVLIGKGDPFYKMYLNQMVHLLELTHRVHFYEGLERKDLEIEYRRADAFVCVSLHEGFCIPLVESMKVGLPVFYYPCTAIPETMGLAGCVLPELKPSVIAETISKNLLDLKIRNKILDSQTKRLLELSQIQSKEVLQRKVLSLFTGSIPTLPTSPPIE